MKKYLLIPAAALVTGTLLFTGCGQAQGQMPDTVKVQNVDENVIRVSSREQVKVEPDIAKLVYGVYSQASDAETCQTQNNTDLQHVIDMLKEQGVAETSIQTSSYGMNPIYDWESGKTITGYEMTTQVTVTDLPMDKVGGVLTASVDAGINSIESVTYQSSKYDASYQEALAKAISTAKVKAEAMAAAGSCKLGKIVNIEEYAGNQTARAGVYNATMKKEGLAMGDMAVMPGQIEVEANITVEFAIE